MSGTKNILALNPFDFRVKGFRDNRIKPLGASYLNAATTSTWEIRTAEGTGGTQIASGSLDYVAGTNGEYVGGPNGTDDGSEDMVVGTSYWVTLILIQGAVKFHVNLPFETVRRTGSSPTT